MTTLSDVLLNFVDCVNRTAPESESGSFFAVGTPAMRGNTIDYSQARRIDRQTFDRWTRRLVPKEGDILLAREAPVGPVVRVPAGGHVAAGQRTLHLRANPARIDPQYLYYYLIWGRTQSRIMSLSMGSTVPHLRVADARTFDLDGLRPRTEQRAIAEVLGALDEKIAANRRVVELGHDLGTTICKSAEAKPRPLINVADIVMGTSPRGDQLNELGSGVPFFQGVRDFGSVFPSTRVYTSSPQRMATAGSILFSVRAPVGQTNLAVGDVCIGRGLAALHTQEQPATLYFSLKAYPEVWDIYSGGGTVFSSITGKELQQTLVPMPDAFMTSDVELKLSALLKRLVAAARENQVLASTRDELLPLLMSGRITVGAASSRVEEVV